MEFSTLNGYKVKDKKAVRYYDNVESMKSDTTLKEGMHVKTSGYYLSNDGGHGEYVIVDDDTLVDDGGSIHVLTNGLRAKLIVDDVINIKQFGTKSDGITNDYNQIMNAITYSKNIKFENGKTYYVNNRIILDNLTDLNIDGNNSTFKFTGYADESVGNDGFIQIEDCSDIIIKNLNIDGNIEWIERPYSWESEYSNYNTLRNKTYDGFRIYNSNNIIIDNCKATKIKVGFHFSLSTNCKLNNSQSTYTMADGVLIHGGCENIHVTNHFVNKGNDDQFSMVHESNDTNYIKRCSYRDCNAIDSFGACCVMQECVDCYASNCTSINNKDVPFKMGTSSGTFACTNCTMDNIKVESENTIQGTSANLSTAQSNGTMCIAYTSGNVSLDNCLIKNSSFVETSGNNLSLYNPNHSGLKFQNCLIDGINIIFVGVNDILFDNCIIKSHDGNTQTRCSITFRNCSITDDLTYSTRGNRALSCNNCHDIILDNVILNGHTQSVQNLLSFYCDDNTYSTAYVDVNETNINITNMTDVYKNGVLKLADINNYAYGRFREGQLVYFESNDGLYLVHGTGWTKLNS